MEEKTSLKERMTALRSVTDYKLPLKCYTMVAIDGHSFSKLIKNKYKKPFDDEFIHMMNEVAEYVCKNVEGCKFAYTQSDEITFVLTDFDTETTCAYFGNRLTKILSIIPSMASAKFNQLVMANLLKKTDNIMEAEELILNQKLADFDCKAWPLGSFNDVYAYILWRQIDCIRNSKQQAAQTWCSHKELSGLNTDEQINLLKIKTGIDWNEFPDDRKYGRFIYKEKETYYNKDIDTEYERSIWKSHDAFPITGEEGKERFIKLNVIPDIDKCKNFYF